MKLGLNKSIKKKKKRRKKALQFPCDQQLGQAKNNNNKNNMIIITSILRWSSQIKSGVCWSSKVHCHVRWLAQIRAELKLLAKTINCKELIEKERKHFSSPLYSSRLPSSQHAFVEGADSSVRGAAEENVGVLYIKGASTRTRRNTPEVKGLQKNKHCPLFWELRSVSPMIREKSEGRGGRECADNVISGHICFIRVFERDL